MNGEETGPAVQRGLDSFGNQPNQTTSTPREPDGDHAVNRGGKNKSEKRGILRGFQLNRHSSFCSAKRMNVILVCANAKWGKPGLP